MKKPGRRQASPGFAKLDKNSQDEEPGQLELLAPPPFAPTWPNDGTLAAAALARLLTGERLTQPKFGTNRWRLAAYIMELKYLGWPVKAAPIHHPGRARPISQYWVPGDIIAAAKAMRGAK